MAKIFREKKCIFKVCAKPLKRFCSHSAFSAAFQFADSATKTILQPQKRLRLPPRFSTAAISKENKSWGGYGYC